jgi:hypothetical protein
VIAPLDRVSFRGLLIPATASGIVFLALLWARGDIPWIPMVSEVVGLVAVLVASGAAAEPILRGNRWTVLERLGLAVAVSAAFTALAGLILHITALPVTTTNVLSILFVTSVALGLLSWPSRPRRLGRLVPSSRRIDVTVAASSLVLLAAAFGAILVARPAPGPPAIEVALVDDAGRLMAQPLLARVNSEVRLNIAIRSGSGSASPASLSVRGEGVRTWSIAGVIPTSSWSVIAVQLIPIRPGTVDAVLDVRSAHQSLRLPLRLEVAAVTGWTFVGDRKPRSAS